MNEAETETKCSVCGVVLTTKIPATRLQFGLWRSLCSECAAKYDVQYESFIQRMLSYPKVQKDAWPMKMQ